MASATFFPAVSTDNGYANNTGEYFPAGYNQSYLETGRYTSNNDRTWLRFSLTGLAPGATILAASLRLTAYDTRSSATAVARIAAVAADNPAAPTSASACMALATGTAIIDWTMPAMVDGTVYQTPDLAAVVQEFVGRPGYAAGAHLLLVLTGGLGSVDAYRRFSTLGYNGGAEKPGLAIEWSTGAEAARCEAAGVPPVIFLALASAAAAQAAGVPPLSPRVVRAWAARHRVPVGRTWAGRHLAPGLSAVWTARHTVPGWVSRAWTGRHAIPGRVSRVWAARHAVLAGNPVAAVWQARHQVPSDDVAVYRPAVWSAVLDGGTALDLLAATISGDRDSYAWTCDLTLPGEAEWRACAPGRRLSLTLSGQRFELLIEGRAGDRSPGGATWTATARTLTCLLGEPYAAGLTQSWPETTARQAAHGLAALAGLSLTWSVCDWVLPAGLLTAENETPAAVLARIAAACGACLQPDPTGGLRVAYRYPVGVTEYGATAPRAVLSADADVLTLSETFSPQPGYDAVTVVDNQATITAPEPLLAFELDDTRNAGRTTFPPGEPVYIRVYHEAAYALRATSGRLERVAVGETESVTETVPFDGVDTASLGRLVAAVDTVTWFGPNLGRLVPAGSSNVVLPGGAGFSVAVVTYRTRYDVHKLVPAALAETFPVLLELSEVEA
jgi:hypothetical protein